TITVEAGGRRRGASVNPAQSYLCSNDPRVHFGLGPAGGGDSISGAWPDGPEGGFAGRAPGQAGTLRQGEGRPAVGGEGPVPPRPIPLRAPPSDRAEGASSAPRPSSPAWVSR